MANYTLSDQKPIFSSLIKSLQNGTHLIRNGYFSVFIQELRKRLYSQSVSVGLRRSLNEPFENPDAKIEITIRPFKKEDFDFLVENGELEKSYPRLVADYRSLMEADIPECYVAVTADDEPCYMQWLIGAESNHLIKQHFGDSFPLLKQDEALLEGAFMQRTFRGMRIMPAAMSRIAEKAGKDVEWVQTFVDIKNIPSLKGCKRSGFSPYLVKEDRWFLFRRSISFHQVSETVLDQYRKATGS